MRISIRKQLLSLFAPFLFGLWIISAMVSYWLVSSYVDEAFDRHLINAANSVIGRLRDADRKVTIDLPPAAQYILKHEEADSLYYRVLDNHGVRIDSGDDQLPAPEGNLRVNMPHMRAARVEGKEVRLVEIKVEPPEWQGDLAIVQVAETMILRNRFKEHMLAGILLPQVLIITVGLLAFWDGVNRILKPLRTLQSDLANRSKFDLSPVEDANVPEEVFPLVQAINQLFDLIGKKVKAQQRFIANAAHQLRTPLAGLKTYSSIGTEMTEKKDLEHIVLELDKGLDRASRIVHQLLALARVDESERNLPDNFIDLSSLAAKLTGELKEAAGIKAVKLSCSLSETDCRIKGDEAELRHLIVNLIENAIAYTPEGGVVTVTVSREPADTDKADRSAEAAASLPAQPYVLLSVSDTGCGIAVSERQKIFERFYRVDETAGIGSGLGLAIVKEVANAHGADITVEDGPSGTGSCFRVRFPL